MSGGTPDLYTVAIAMWHFQRMKLKDAFQAAETTKAEQAQRVERFREELQKVVWEREDIRFRINGGCVEAEVEGLRFVALEIPGEKEGEHLALVTLLGRCSLCSLETRSEPIYNLPELGRMLEEFKPSHSHLCYWGS